MSILIQVKPSIEDRLREMAFKKGLKIDQFISQFLEKSFSDAPPLQPSVSAREAALLQQVNLDIAPETWQLYAVFKKKFQENQLTDEELTQFRDIAEQVEMANANRIEVLAELAQIRNVSLREVMAQLGISKHE
jgi:hypothetical protein